MVEAEIGERIVPESELVVNRAASVSPTAVGADADDDASVAQHVNQLPRAVAGSWVVLRPICKPARHEATRERERIASAIGDRSHGQKAMHEVPLLRIDLTRTLPESDVRDGRHRVRLKREPTRPTDQGLAWDASEYSRDAGDVCLHEPELTPTVAMAHVSESTITAGDKARTPDMPRETTLKCTLHLAAKNDGGAADKSRIAVKIGGKTRKVGREEETASIKSRGVSVENSPRKRP
jgi:hypothetical protein